MRSLTRRDLPSLAAEGALLGLALGGSAYLLFRLLGFEYGLDQGIYSVVADALLRGDAPYRDAWDFKPPGVFAVYALARASFGDSMQAVRGLEVLGLVSVFPAFAIFSRWHVGSARAGLLGAALATSGHVWLGFWQTAQPESFGIPLVAWALVLAAYEPRRDDPRSVRRRRLAWAAAGAAYALAGLLKPPLGGGVLVALAIALRRVSRAADAARPALGRWEPVLVYGIGAAVPICITVGFFFAHGAWGDLSDALLGFAPEYTRLNLQDADFRELLFRSVEFLLFRFSWLNLVGLALLIALPRTSARESEGVWHVVGVLTLQLLGIAVQARFFPYHFGAAVALVALLAGWGSWKLVRLGRPLGLGAAAAVALALSLANVNETRTSEPASVLERLRSVDAGTRYNRPKRRVAAWLQRHTDAGDAIYVWGFDPVLYDLADRRPASRYVYNAPQRAPWYRARARPRLMADLRRSPPAAILVQRDDPHPGTTGGSLDSREALEGFPALARLIEERYRPATTLAGFTIHLARPAATQGERPSTATPPRDTDASRDRPGRAARP